VEESCEHGNELSGSLKYWKILEEVILGGFSRRARVHIIRYLTI
jgi:hypothetical protein